VGICSTTYGDLVCRGCKRFAHEIVQWNGFDDEQRELVWERLLDMRDGAVASLVAITDEEKLLAWAERFKVPEREALSPGNLAFEVLRRVRGDVQPLDLGLEALGLPADTPVSAPELYRLIEQELFARSVARYERDFHIPAQ
jgi:predicted Fe-S protein YdhL (DUF1289 family)